MVSILIQKLIDHTLLKPEATLKDIEKLCEEAKLHNFASVCINPCYVKNAVNMLQDTEVKVCTVVGFPLGATTLSTKIAEVEQAFKDGATEIDMVINIGNLKERKLLEIKKEINSINKVVKENNGLLKVIVETALLNKKEIKMISYIVGQSGADFIKTSTGFAKADYTYENLLRDVKIMKRSIPSTLSIKASGGIKTNKQAQELVSIGVKRLGTSSGLSIVNQEENLTSDTY